jgi:hypothetical protein
MQIRTNLSLAQQHPDWNLAPVITLLVASFLPFQIQSSLQRFVLLPRRKSIVLAHTSYSTETMRLIPGTAVGLLLIGEASAFQARVRTRSFVQSPNDSSLNLFSGLIPSSTSVRDDDEPLLNNRHSASDWLYNIRSMPHSKVLRDVRNPVLSAAGWSLAVAAIQKLLGQSSMGSLQALSRTMCIPTSMHSFLVSAIGLLLVFRTNSAYQRFYVSAAPLWVMVLVF